MFDNILRTPPSTQLEILQGGGGFAELGTSIKIFLKTQGKEKGPAGKLLEFFLLDTLKTTF